MAAAVFAIPCELSLAATRAWNAGSAGWTLATNWNPNGTPAALDVINITETDGVSRTITYDYTGANVTLTSLTIDLTSYTGTNTTTLSMPANILTATNEYVGNSGTGTNGTGTFLQSGGTNTATASLYLGFNATDQGFYTLSGNSTLVVTSNEYVGYNGIGNFTQSGGNVSIKGTTDLFLGNSAGSSGTYTLTAGTLAVGGGEVIGNLGSGNFTQTGGANTIASFGFYVGLSALGNYTLSGNGTIVSTANEYIGFNNNGNFTQNGGTNTITSASLYLGNGTSSTGTYTLNTGNLTIAGIGYIGFGGAGLFNQNGGNLTITGGNSLILANSATASGAYTLSGGNATITGNVYVGGSAIAGGTGILTVTGTSVLSITGTLTAYSTTNTSINLSGGTITTGGLNFNGTPSLFVWTAGVLSINTSVAWDSAAAANSTSAAFGTALSLGANQSLLVTGNETIGGTGAFSLTLNAGSNHTVTGNVTLNPTGTITQLPGSTFSSNTFTQAGGTVNGTLQNAGSFLYQSGTFNGRLINLGTVSLGRTFTAGNGIENDTSLTLGSGQSLTVNGQGLANYGTFTLSSGTLTGTGPLTNYATFTGCGTISGSAGLVNYGLFSTTSGLTLFSNTGGFQNQPGASVYLAGGYLFKLSAAAITNDGNFNVNSATLTGAGSPGEQFVNNADGVITGPGVISVPLTNFGMLYISAGSLNTPAFTNNGVIEIAGNSANFSATGVVTNAGTIEGNGKVSAAITNTGTLESTNGTLALSGALVNTSTGTLRADANTKILLQGAATFPTNAGLISLVGGTFDTGGQPLNNTGQITGYGILSTAGTTGGLTNNGNITFTGGTSTINGNVTNAAGKFLFVKYQPAIFTGNITNNGNITVTNTTVTFTGAYIGNNYFSDPSTNIFQNNVTILPGGTMTGSTGDSFIFSNGLVANAGTFTNGGTLQSASNLTNSGNFTQSGPQTWSPGTTFTNTAGLATFGSNAKLYGLTITAGTVDTITSKLVIEPANKSTTLAALETALYTTHSLTSSALLAHTALALIDNATLLTPFTTFGGNPADTGSILLAPELLGDANADGKVDLTDLNTVLNHLGTPNPNWTAGNFDGAATIDLTDLNAVLNNLGTSYTGNSAALAPEPASLALLVLGIPTLLRRKK
jgi:hypothetical protein